MQLFHYVEDFDDTNQLKSQEWLEATDALLKSVIHLHSFSSELLAFIYYMRGRAYRVVGKKELALQNFQQALKLEDPTNYAQQGWVHFYSQNYQEALAFQNRALERNPRDENAYIGRGWAYTNLGDYELAIADFDHARELDPNKNPGGRENGLRWAYYSSGKYQQALSVNNYFLERDSSDYKPYLFRSWCFRSLKDYSQSIDACNKALELDPNNAEVYVELGWAYYYSRDFLKALTYHKQALEHNPRDAGAYIGRGWAYLQLDEYRLSIADFNHAAELDPNVNPGGRENGLRWAYYNTGQYQQALSANDHLFERELNFPEEYYVFRSRCFLSLKDYPLCIDACNRALELAPKQVDAYFQRGLAYLWLKDLGQAQADFTRSCEQEPTKIEAVLQAEWIRMCQGAADLLISERLEAIATVAIQDYTAHICLGIALLLRRNLSGALAELEQALLSTRHEKWEAHFWKGMICAYLEQDEEAIAAIERALEIELPPILLTPLHRFEQDRPDFYQEYVVPFMARYDLV
jgi:tetratricopeptide (TPR) repeat protein